MATFCQLSTYLLQLAVFELDAHALLHEVHRYQQPCFLFTPQDGSFVSCEGATADSNFFARFKTAFDRQRNADVDQVSHLSQIMDELGDVGDRRCLLNAARANRFIANVVIAADEHIVIKERRVRGPNAT